MEVNKAAVFVANALRVVSCLFSSENRNRHLLFCYFITVSLNTAQMNSLQFEKIGTLSEAKVFEWSVPGWVLNHKYSTKRSDIFTLDDQPNFKFCFMICCLDHLSSSTTSIMVQLHRVSVIDVVNEQENSSPKKSNDFFPVMNVRFILLKADSIYKWSGTMKLQGSTTKVTFPEINTFDNLVIQCTMAPDSPVVICDDLCDGTMSFDNPNFVKANSLVEDMETLLSKGMLSDITICVDDKEFNAHRCILASRSAVFAAMFNHNTLEQQENRIVIVDFESDIVFQMLKYIYTENIEELSPPQYLSLLSAADKYALLGLKKICSKYLRNNMPSNLVVHVLIVANLHEDEGLKEAAVKMFLANPASAMNTSHWIPFLKNHTELANTILQRLAKKSVK